MIWWRMRSSALAVIVLLTALMIPAFGRAGVSAAPTGEYIALGDSIAAGMISTLPRARGYPALVNDLLSRQSETHLTNLAVPGETAESFMQNGQLTRFTDRVNDFRSRGVEIRLVTVTLGGNDLLRLRDLGQADRQAGLDSFRTTYPAALNAIRQALGDSQARVLVTTYYDLSEGDPEQQGSDSWWLTQFNEVIRSTARDQGAVVADLAPAFRGEIERLTWYPVDIHPNNAGHEAIARVVWTALGSDTTAPSVTIDRPVSGEVSRSIPTILATATDDIGITGVELWVDNERVSTLIPLPGTDQYLGLWDGREHAGTSVELSVRARDLAGHEGTASVTIIPPAR